MYICFLFSIHRGRGRHKAGLNIGDCCSYALAKLSEEPLLFKRDDFGETDVAAAWLAAES